MNAPSPSSRVLLAPWQQRRNQGSAWPLYLLAGLLGVPALAALVLAPAGAVTTVAVAVLAVPFFGGWIWLLLGLRQQNHPNAARLVPGHVRTLRRVMRAAWLAFTAFAMLLGIAIGHPWAMGAGAALMLTLLAWTLRTPLVGVVGWLALISNPLWLHTPAAQAALRPVLAAWHSQPDAIALAALSALLAAALASPFAVLRAGGAEHAQIYRRRARQLAAVRIGGGGPGSCRSVGGGLGRWTDAGATDFYRRWLARVGTRRAGAVLPRALLGLGPSIHWTGQFGQLLSFGGVAIAVLLVLWQASAGTDAIAVAAWGLSAGVLTFAVNVALQARAAIHGTRREQALMMLLPGMPRGRALNRALARRLSLQFLASWTLGVVASAAIVPSGTQEYGWFAIYAAACLPVGALLWTDWSRVRAPTAMSGAVPMMVVMPLAIGAIAAQAWMGVATWVSVLAFVVAAVLVVVWRAWRMKDAPSAFPAGRLSQP